MKTKLPLLIAIIALFLNNATAQEPGFWGMTQGGGESNTGVIFKTDTNGENQSVEFSFAMTPGAKPMYTKLCQASNGKLYGMTTTGAGSNSGGIFEYDPVTNLAISVFSFSRINGEDAQGSLIQASNGKLYGMTLMGGAHNDGVLFEFDPVTKIYEKKIEFDSYNGHNGDHPSGGLVQASNGKLYGFAGGLIEYNIATNICTKKVGTNGYGDLIQASNGRLYGIAYGSIIEYIAGRDSLNRILTLGGFGSSTGAYGSLMQASNGKLYGMTLNGGINNDGVLFEYNTTTNTAIKKLDFDGTNNGSAPYGSLIQASNGKLYGMTAYGGINDIGVLFEYDYSTNTYSKKLDFDGANKGAYPHGTLMQASNGSLYGVTSNGGEANWGVIFEYNTVSDTYIRKLNFHFNDHGSNPFGSLLQASNGKLYGITQDGGINSQGVLFEHDPITNVFTIKFEFDGINGETSYGSLIQASNGKLYGMTSQGGTNSRGVIFEYDIATGIFTKKYDMTSDIYPKISLMQASNGKLYGMTRYTIFEYDPDNNIYIVKHNFTSSADGTDPLGNLIQATSGKLYGMTQYGGANGNGVLFEYNLLTDTYSKKIDFDGANIGRNPIGSLIQASNGMLYGMTTYGGTVDDGVLFEYDPTTNILTKKMDFEEVTKGKNPKGSLMQASSGKLYGMTTYGGANSMGVLFEYDLDTDTFTKKLDYNYADGFYPMYGHLIELSDEPSSSITVQNIVITGSETECFNATGTITVAGAGTTVVVSPGAQATFIAGQKIIFNPGFSSIVGSYTDAHITTTNNYCDSQQSMLETESIETHSSQEKAVATNELTDDNSNIAISIYPNPTNGNTTIDFMGVETTADIMVLNFQGGKVLSTSCNNSTTANIDISNMPQGMYVIVIKTQLGVVTKRLVKAVN